MASYRSTRKNIARPSERIERVLRVCGWTRLQGRLDELYLALTDGQVSSDAVTSGPRTEPGTARDGGRL